MAIRDNRSKRSPSGPKRSGFTATARRVAVFGIAIVFLAAAIGLLASSRASPGSESNLPPGSLANTDLNPLEAAYLRVYLAANQAALTAPPSNDTTAIDFEVTTGETAGGIADDLKRQGLIADSVLFRNYVRYRGLDKIIEAGTYQIRRNMSIQEIALALTKATGQDISVRVTEGWRREQVADLFDQQADTAFHGADFLAATSGAAPQWDQFRAAHGIPQGMSLDGFLFPDTYRIGKESDANVFIGKMLENFDLQVTVKMRADAQARGMTIYQVVTLASIVEREAVIDAERPLIASVYLNRLANGMKLEADPTVQYAMGYQVDTKEWWNLNLTQADYQAVDSPYNTYLHTGLPPGPIANPGLASISAVIYPANTPYLFFRAKCDGSGQHNFATTFEEHAANACP